MKFEKEIKRVTIFPSRVKKLDESSLANYIIAFVHHKYMPSVNKGTAINLDNSGKLETADEWSADLKNQEIGISVTVGNERIDILCEGSKIETWDAFKSEVYRILNIISSVESNGFNRIAIGNRGELTVDKNHIEKFFSNLYSPENQAQPMVEWLTRWIKRSFLNDGKDLTAFEFNNALTVSFLQSGNDKFIVKIDNDINSVVGVDSDLINSMRDLFIDKAISLINDNMVKCENLLSL